MKLEPHPVISRACISCLSLIIAGVSACGASSANASANSPETASTAASDSEPQDTGEPSAAPKASTATASDSNQTTQSGAASSATAGAGDAASSLNTETTASEAVPAGKSEGKEADVASESARNVKYVVNPEGLRVEVEGVSFSPKAEAVKVSGGYSIRLRVEARAKDGKTHSILAPTGKELAFAGTVKSPQGESRRFGDKREGDRAVTLAQKPLTLQRAFPDSGEKPLVMGEELDLMVGLWGLGFDEASRRPLNKFFRLTVKLDKEKPRVVIAPPEGTTKG